MGTYLEALRQQHMMGGAMRRMLHRQLSMAWEKWQFTAAEMAAQQRLLDSAMRKFKCEDVCCMEHVAHMG